jgi:hypothetical protein
LRLVLARALTCGFVLQVVHLVRAGAGSCRGVRWRVVSAAAVSAVRCA